MEKKTILITLSVLFLSAFSGCEPKNSAMIDISKPMETVKTEAAGMDTAELREMALKYKNAILAQKDKINNLMKNIRQSQTPEAAQTDDTQDLMTKIGEMKKRYDIYIDLLKERNADITGLKLSD